MQPSTKEAKGPPLQCIFKIMNCFILIFYSATHPPKGVFLYQWNSEPLIKGVVPNLGIWGGSKNVYPRDVLNRLGMLSGTHRQNLSDADFFRF